jgi:glycosyltransferase involved in cell wall biosynthesis
MARISFLAPVLARLPGGGARTYYEHASSLAERGHDVTVVHSLNYGPGLRGRLEGMARQKVRDLKAGNLTRRVSWLPIDPRVRMVFVPAFDGRASLPPADLRIGTYWETNEFRASLPSDGSARMQLIQAWEVWAGPRDRVEATWRLPFETVVVSQSLYQRGLDLGLDRSRLHLAANGIDHELFQVRTPVAQRSPCVAFLAHDAPVKGLAEAVEALSIVHRQRRDIDLLAFGGQPRPAILPDFVTYRHKPLGRTLADEIYNRATIFLCPSQSEGFGFPSLEAMACGAALVSTRNGGVDDFGVDGESALLAEVGDAAGLAAAILKVSADDELRLRLSAAGRASAARFTWGAATDAFAAAVDAALSRPSR